MLKSISNLQPACTTNNARCHPAVVTSVVLPVFVKNAWRLPFFEMPVDIWLTNTKSFFAATLSPTKRSFRRQGLSVFAEGESLRDFAFAAHSYISKQIRMPRRSQVGTVVPLEALSEHLVRAGNNHKRLLVHATDDVANSGIKRFAHHAQDNLL